MSTAVLPPYTNQNPHYPSEVYNPTISPNEGEITILGPDKVKYISPPRQTQNQYNPYLPQMPPPYQSTMQPQMPTCQYASNMQPMMMMPQPIIQPMPMFMQPTMQQPQQPSPPSSQNINVVVNSSGGSGGAGSTSPSNPSGVLICPKCRKGIIVRQQDKKRKKKLICLAVCCFPISCCIPLLCLHWNFVDGCACCGKSYGHRGRKNSKNKVKAVKV
ncbi:unnamed protein product [Caenorhabditis bovis]|uniref:LITAF domain-containing protein n=1 Tax=Caenorhabditis bovis TaxID=2654633 RepID=A0A8S1F5N4_9PELO|nr:unnamed protein product [Caenorhabditis bovis]